MTGQRSSLVAQAFGGNKRTFRVFSPVRVFVCRSLYSRYCCPLESTFIVTSPHRIFLCGVTLRKPKLTVLVHQSAFSNDSGCSFPFHLIATVCQHHRQSKPVLGWVSYHDPVLLAVFVLFLLLREVWKTPGLSLALGIYCSV